MLPFIIVLIVILLVTVYLWISRPKPPKKKFKVVKAGKVNKVTPLEVEINDLFNKKYVSDGKELDPNNFEIFIVDGMSMSKFGINNGDAVFVRKLYANQKYNIQDNPVLLFEIDSNKDNCPDHCKEVIEFKLRKFISYIPSESKFDDWFNDIATKHPDLLQDKDSIRDKYNEILIKFKENNPIDSVITFSVSYNAETDDISYSFHPIKFLYGIVDYVIPKEKIKC